MEAERNFFSNKCLVAGEEAVFLLDVICNPDTTNRIEYNSNVVFTMLDGNLFRIQIQQTTANQSSIRELVGSVLWSTNGFFIATTPSVNRFSLIIDADGNLIIRSRQRFDGLLATWTFTVTGEITSGSVCVTRSFGGSIPLPPATEPTPAGCPSLEGSVTPTQDEQQICQMDFTVIIPQGPCEDCPTQITNNFTNQILQYRYYSPDVARVVKGHLSTRVGGPGPFTERLIKGCTLAQKVSSLQTRGKSVTLENLATYSTLRLALSKLVFGNFDVDYLRQSYYTSLIKKLRKSQFCRFLARLQIPAYANYETLFLC